MARYDFHQEYAGPLGPHLSCLTQFTLTRDESKRVGVSIHPRVMGGRVRFEKLDTCEGPKATTKARLKAALSDHCRRHPNDRLTAARLARLAA